MAGGEGTNVAMGSGAPTPAGPKLDGFQAATPYEVNPDGTPKNPPNGPAAPMAATPAAAPVRSNMGFPSWLSQFFPGVNTAPAPAAGGIGAKPFVAGSGQATGYAQPRPLPTFVPPAKQEQTTKPVEYFEFPDIPGYDKVPGLKIPKAEMKNFENEWWKYYNQGGTNYRAGTNPGGGGNA
jgi:hypothetical protein